MSQEGNPETVEEDPQTPLHLKAVLAPLPSL